MKLLLRAGAFIFGMIATIVVVGILDDTFPWFWLPLLMGLAVSAVVSAQVWIRPSRLAPAFCASLTGGAALTYSMSATAITTRHGPKIPHNLLVCLALFFLYWLLIFLGRGLNQAGNKALTCWLLIPIAASSVVGYVSGGIGGSDHMVRWLIAMTHMPQQQAETVVHFFRKSIHVSAYGVVGLSLFRAALSGKASKTNAIVFGMLTTLCIASFDEIRQTTAPNRTGSAWDVALDLTGALVFICIGSLFIKGNGGGSQEIRTRSAKSVSSERQKAD